MENNREGKLAVVGGAPVCKDLLAAPAWPPVLETTADRLREIYFSRQWSFNSPTEQEFERDFAAYHGARHGIFMVNGTVTLQAALGALGIGPGDEVIVPALTWMATAMAVHYVGAKPVFVDIEADTLCMDAARVEAALSENTKAVIPVHIYGSMADMDAILGLARKHNLAVVEDCAHMQGGKWRGRGVGSWGDIGSFSFQQSKTLACGEGGICLTNDDNLADRLYRLKHIGYGRGMKQGQIDQGPPAGLTCHNFRGTAFQAAILHGQLAGLEKIIDKYEQSSQRIRAKLENIEGVRVQSRGREASPQGYYALIVIFDGKSFDAIPAARLREAMEAEGLRVGGTYGTVYRHMLYNMAPNDYRMTGDGTCPVAETAGTSRALGISHNWLGADEETIDTIGEIFAKVARGASALIEG